MSSGTATSTDSRDNPLVSIIMPAYNAEETIECAIDSIRSQSYRDWELIVVDDHSTDKTQDISAEYARVDGRISVLKNSGKGVSSARNRGIQASHGDFIAFLDADDFYYEDALKERLEYLLNNRRCNAVFCPAELVDEELHELGWTYGGKLIVGFSDMHTCPFHINSVMLRSHILDGLAFDERFANGEDWLLWQRIARMGIQFHLVDGCRVGYRQSTASTVLSDFPRHQDTLAKVISTVYDRDPDCPHPHRLYEQGLREPPKELVLMKRRFHLLLHLLMDQEVDRAEEIVQDFEPSLWSQVDISQIAAITKFAVMRYYICPVDDWLASWRQHSTAIRSFLENHFPAESYINMGDELFDRIEELGRSKGESLVWKGLRRIRYSYLKAVRYMKNRW